MKITSPIVFLSIASLSWAQDLVDSPNLQNAISSTRLLTHTRRLVEFSRLSNGNRVFGSAGHNATVDYIKNALDETGYYDTQLQTFSYLFSASGIASFSASGTPYASVYLTYVPSGDVSAPLVIVNNLGCQTGGYTAAVAGNIAVIKRGTCEFGHKVALAGAAGAVGAIIYNNEDGAVPGGTLGVISRPDVGPYIPVTALFGLDDSALIGELSAGQRIVGSIHVEAVIDERYTNNVIATTKLGDQNNVVVAGAHTDSVVAGPGIDEDGSGSMGLLEIALQLPKWRVTNAVRFAFWSAEEFGLIGSDYDLANLSEEERSKVALYLNFDMIASPQHGIFQHYTKAEVKSMLVPFGSGSDYRTFLDAGIPTGAIFSGSGGIMTDEQAGWWNGLAGVAYDKCYHEACDGVDNLNVDASVLNTKAAAHAVAKYARSLDGIPRPSTELPARSLKIPRQSHDEISHQDCRHEPLLAI
ncbi:hypothetical protein NLJ89_g1280 [Agrocybe chaxingu]|uniref:Peptide hydrolase n=1 Tax=Agrocybe chaxingu TaxID=84603 RepID=A0A9W8N0E2_9AGAR|nr:hypothetical protein NLJ89_g1280 [Agrocybe chaxingu]